MLLVMLHLSNFQMISKTPSIKQFFSFNRDKDARNADGELDGIEWGCSSQNSRAIAAYIFSMKNFKANCVREAVPKMLVYFKLCLKKYNKKNNNINKIFYSKRN